MVNLVSKIACFGSDRRGLIRYPVRPNTTINVIKCNRVQPTSTNSEHLLTWDNLTTGYTGTDREPSI